MAVRFYTELDTIKTMYISATIYGDPGMGKTSLAFTAKDCLLIDFDEGVQRSVKPKNSVRVDNWEDVILLQRSPEIIKMAPKTIVMDTGGTMIDNYIAEYVKGTDPKNTRTGGELSLQGYGAIKSVFKQFKNWTKTMGCNVIFVCHATADPNKDGKIIPKMTGGALDILRQESDLIGYLFSDKNMRVIDFKPVDSHDGKDCANIGLVEIPDYKTPEFDDFFQTIIDKTLERMNEITEKQKETLAKIQVFRDKVPKVKTVKGFNDLIASLMDEGKAIQVQIFNELKNHGIESNIAMYEAATKKFVKTPPVEPDPNATDTEKPKAKAATNKKAKNKKATK